MMWKFFNGLSRNLRTRAPAPPSQTASRIDDNDSTLNVASSAPTIQNRPTPQKELEVYGHTQCQNATEILQRILGQPSEVDILLREFFGQSWKSNTKNKKHNTGGRRCENTSDHLVNGVSLGTAWITVLILGRAAFTSWKSHQRRELLFSDGFTRQEFENCYSDASLSNISEDEIRFYLSYCHSRQTKCWRSRLSILPKTFSNYTTVLAAGSDVDSKNYQSFEIRSGAGKSLQPVESVTKLKPNKKSVTFDYDFTEDDSLQSEQSSNSLSDEAIEQFAEDTRGCSGATYDILGLQSARSGNYKEAFQRFQLGAGEGYSKALFNAGLCYEQGLGTQKDMAKAIEAYKKAAHKGHAQAQHNLGLILLKKEQIADKVYALRLLEKAALSGLVQAQSYLGSYLAKPGAFQNLKKAVKMFKLAVEREDVVSKYHLGICYERGLGGLKQDLLQAFDLYSSAASAGNLDAKYQMAVMLNVGFEGLDKDSKLAHLLLASAAKSGHRPSRKLLKEWQSTRGNASKREITTSYGKSFKVYHTTGAKGELHAPKQSPFTRDYSLLTLETIHKSNETERKLQTNGGHDQLHRGLMTGILSRHLADVKLMNDLAPRFNYKPPSGGAGSNFDQQIPSQSHEFADVADFLRMPRPRSSTTPNLCYHSPVVKDSVNALSLNV